MAKKTSVYICQSCDYQIGKWSGQCPGCGEWNTLVETSISSQPQGFNNNRIAIVDSTVSVINLQKIAKAKFSRVQTGILELDRVLGGGIVPGSLVLVAGAPGVGKSTLLTQVVATLKGLYVLGEESPQQVRLRVERLRLNLDFDILAETQAEIIAGAIEKQSVVIIDSIQTLWSAQLKGMAGSVGQIRESAQILLQRAKAKGVPIFLVGHITKDGVVAGPKVLEHLVDTVLQFEGDKIHEYRLLRASKNRFGPTDEVGVFAMQDKGLVEISNPAELFLQDKSTVPGSVVVVSMQGLRPVLIEVQALVNFTSLAMPRRVATGIDQKRLQIICAILEKHAGLKLSTRDVFVNIAGGLNLKEPGVDLGLCLAIASSYKNKSISNKTVAIGEVGLLGEIRSVGFESKRIKEAKAQGFDNVLSAKTVKSIKQAIKEI